MHDAAPKYGVMICGHGSRSKSAVTEFAVLAEKLAPMFPDWPVEYGYLEFATPVITRRLVEQKACIISSLRYAHDYRVCSGKE